MALNDRERKKLLEYISGLPDDELAGYLDKVSQSAMFNPDVKEQQMVGVQYPLGTRAGRAKYDQDKAAAKDALDEIGSLVTTEKAKRSEQYRADKIEPNREANKKGIFGIRDDADEEGLSLQEVVEKRINKENAVAASDDNQLQRELGGINPEAMQAARADRESASQRSIARGVRNSTARLDREAEAGFARAEQELADADAARMREGEEAFAAESDRQRASQMTEARRAMDEGADEQGPDLQNEAMALFPKIMGSSFDPKSSMDRGKLEIIVKAKRENPDLSPNQLALKIYRDYM